MPLRFLPLPLLCLLLTGLMTLAWWLPNRPMAKDVAMPEPMFNSVSFAPYRAWQSPLTDVFPSAAEVDEDLAMVARRSRAIRTYAAIEGNYDTVGLAARHGLKVWQGIWLGSDRARNALEIARAIELARKYPDTIDRVVVGNEVLLRRDLPPAELIADIDEVRAAVRQKVTYADVWEFWKQFPAVADHVDIVTIHLLPYWEDDPTGIDRAVAHVGAAAREIADLFPGKTIAIGETGWPSRGRWRRDAAPSVVNQAIFLRQFISLARREHYDYNLIEAFDQIWKYRNEGVVGANWGLWTADRTVKFPLDGPVVENPDWPASAALSIGLGCLLLGFALATRPGLAARSQACLAVLAFTAGGALAYAQAETAPILYDVHVRLAAAFNLGGQALLAALLMARAALILSGAPRPLPRTGRDASNAVRDLLLLRLPPLTAWFDDLGFVFLWSAAVLQLLLVFDGRYRDTSLPAMAVPLVAMAARALLRDLPMGGGREEALAAGTLMAGALISWVIEGPLNRPFLLWNLAALALASPYLLSAIRSAGRRSQDQAPSARPTIPQVAL